MFGDAYMLRVARTYPKLRVAAAALVDSGLVYTDLILKMPKYAGSNIGDITTAQSPEEGVKGRIRLLFDCLTIRRLTIREAVRYERRRVGVQQCEGFYYLGT